GKAVPRIIDFGVAKATGQALTDKTLVTGFGNIVGTLEYMAPEQAEINQLDIDTRSDIYSLGVLLYELLTGSPPFTRKELEAAATRQRTSAAKTRTKRRRGRRAAPFGPPPAAPTRQNKRRGTGAGGTGW